MWKKNVVVWTGKKTKKHEEELQSLFITEPAKVHLNVLIMNVDCVCHASWKRFCKKISHDQASYDDN